MFTFSASVAIGVSALLLSLVHAHLPCEKKGQFGAGVIHDIFLDADESTFVKVEINNGVYDYCRSFELQNDKLSYEEISCTNKVRPWQEFGDSELEMSLPSTAEFEALNETERVDWIEEEDDSELTVTTPDLNETILLEDVFIHPIYYSYFYSPSMFTLFIFTADQNDSISNASDDEPIQINLVSVAFNPNASTGDYPADLTDFEVAVQFDVVNQAFDAASGFPDDFEMILNGERWLNEDGYMLQMLQVNTVVDECEEPEWIKYNVVADPYNARKGNSSSSVTPFSFSYLGHGFRGIDDRINRAYGYDMYRIWYYEGDTGSFLEFDFETKQLASYYGLMWICLGVFLCLLCCVCFCCIRKCKQRQAKKNRNNEIFGTEMGTVAV